MSMGRFTENGATKPSTAAASTETVITARRPHTSDSELTGMIATASAAVPADIARLAVAGLALNPRESSGSNGCGEYSSAKVASPAANRPSLTLRIPGSPFRSLAVFSRERVTPPTLTPKAAMVSRANNHITAAEVTGASLLSGGLE